MKNSKNIIYSAKRPGRVMVYGPNNLKYVLQKIQDEVDGKSLYVPITVLLPHMNFN